DVGAHRRKVYGDRPSVEEELWKRAWWYLVAFDRIGSVMLGRPCATREEDFDADLPLEVDDEYWENEDPTLAFQQPPDKPCRVSAFKLLLRLTDIIAFTLRTFYALNKDPTTVLHNQQPVEILKDMNAAMLQWTQLVPEYLKWSPEMEDLAFANQSTTIYLTYSLIQILVHRSFLPPSLARLRALGDAPSAGSTSAHTMTSLAIAVNAAKAGARFLHVLRVRGLSNIPILLTASELCAAVLCLDVW
ncbi:hypothetical protein HETIRDRAFT_246745, partial [Heterobasidion irregulare TC 32-1]